MSTGINNNIDCTLQGKLRVVVMEKDKIVHDTGEIKNMITNQGMDEVANRPFAELFACCAIGTGTADTKKTNNPITGSLTSGNGFDINLKYSKATRSGPLVIFPRISPSFPISGSVIRASDVGNIIKINNDSTFRIRAQTGSNQARSCSVLNMDGTVPTGSSSNNDYTIWFTNQISMSNETQRCGRTSDGNNFPAASGSYGTNCNSQIYSSGVIHSRQFNFSTTLVDDPNTITEVGLSWLPFYRSPALFSRIRLTQGSAGNAIPPILAGQNVIVYYSLNVGMSPTTAATGSVNLSGSNKGGNSQMNLYGLSKVSSSGVTTYFDSGFHGNEPYFFNQRSKFGLPASGIRPLYVFTSATNTASPTWGTNITRNSSFVTKSIDKIPTYNRVYPTSSYGYTLTRVATFNDTESINANWNSFGTGLHTGSNLMSFVFGSAQNKRNGYLLAVSQSFNWTRIF